MSECVVRMDLPENCTCCPMCFTADVQGYHWCAALEQEVEEGLSRPKECPILCSLPEGHGRLVDAELVKEILKPVDSISHHEPEWTWGELYESDCVAIDNASTIVPADEYPAYMSQWLGKIISAERSET